MTAEKAPIGEFHNPTIHHPPLTFLEAPPVPTPDLWSSTEVQYCTLGNPLPMAKLIAPSGRDRETSHVPDIDAIDVIDVIDLEKQYGVDEWPWHGGFRRSPLTVAPLPPNCACAIGFYV